MAEPEARGQKPQTNFFRKEGEGAVVRLRDAKGMRSLAHLLSQPGQRVRAAMLLLNVDGPCRGTTANAEQSRVTVTTKTALMKIQEHHPSLGHHLTTCIKTGHFCSYAPDPERPVPWVLR